MNMPTDKEQLKLLAEEEARRKAEADKEDGPITSKMKKMVSEAEERILKNFRPYAERVEDQENALAELGKSFSSGFGTITATAKRLTGKKA